MKGSAAFAALVALAALTASEGPFAAWEPLKKSDSVSLSIDPATIKRSGDQASFRYLVDYAKPQTDFKAGIAYRSLVISAQLRCRGRMVALGNTDLYSEPGGSGVNLGTMFPDRIESSFQRIEVGTSDEDLWRRVCAPKTAPAKK